MEFTLKTLTHKSNLDFHTHLWFLLPELVHEAPHEVHEADREVDIRGWSLSVEFRELCERGQGKMGH